MNEEEQNRLESELKRLRERKGYLQAALERSENVRNAAISGDWEEFDRLVREISGTETTDSDAGGGDEEQEQEDAEGTVV